GMGKHCHMGCWESALVLFRYARMYRKAVEVRGRFRQERLLKDTVWLVRGLGLWQE
nr:hypothetical protein [Tanacetum cinerariifolium]